LLHRAPAKRRTDAAIPNLCFVRHLRKHRN